ncbi:hypothetical protein PVAG01_10149 [Phlyctema vagabunda]|uniref:Transposase IS204/IS1001/IS1096/IS1165 zinc-finger domain-containing protein n=1 Tax=Phlyctema vagabunda TaxID=108571 RepID=A0ABR4P572_9HELO
MEYVISAKCFECGHQAIDLPPHRLYWHPVSLYSLPIVAITLRFSKWQCGCMTGVSIKASAVQTLKNHVLST